MAADHDVGVAIKARWEEMNLDLLVPGGINEKPIPDAVTEPYAVMEIRPAEPRMFTTGDYIDKRLVTITVYGVGKADASRMQSDVARALQSGPLTIHNAKWMRTEPMEDANKIAEDQRRGAQFREATVNLKIWSHRTFG